MDYTIQYSMHVHKVLNVHVLVQMYMYTVPHCYTDTVLVYTTYLHNVVILH